MARQPVSGRPAVRRSRAPRGARDRTSGYLSSTVAPAPSPWLAGFDAKPGRSLQQMARDAGCAAWSPFWRNVTAGNVAAAHALGLKVIPWTVNTPADMATLIDLKVDGMITDYPDRGLQIMKEKGLKLP